MNSQKEGSGKSTSEVQNITSSEISMAGQPEKGAVVYMTADINSDSLMEIYQALGAAPTGRVAVKLSTGEPGSNYLRTDLIGGLVQSLQAAIVECNTAYGGARSNTAMHYQVAKDHGYTAIADIDIMDEGGSMTLPVTGGTNLTENYVGEHFSDYDYYVILSHFKGHAMAGFGGAIKNISIGLASAEGKNHIHTAGKGGSMWSASQDPFLESMAEAGKSVADALNGNILYINVMNRLSVDCDCDTSPAEPDMHDIGILASYDPVALDQACVDLVYAAADGQSLVNRIESRNGIHTLEQAEKIGLGSRTYTLVNLDE
ncbi:putative Fe-S center protein [Enterocloster citroniae]